uniref:Uncharacterized protein n=1 Tax=Rhizophagus irregularis (strain DAOM 181602 / DAOM 197198 / MUCL 43194) TaxID=747089 RepID=U9SKT0_RHIID
MYSPKLIIVSIGRRKRATPPFRWYGGTPLHTCLGLYNPACCTSSLWIGVLSPFVLV